MHLSPPATDVRPRSGALNPLPRPAAAEGRRRGPWGIAILTAGLLGTLAWAYAPTLARLPRLWNLDPQYSHGYVIPFLALVVLWGRRHRLAVHALRPNGWGLVFLLAASVLRLVGAYLYLPWLDDVSLLTALLGTCCLAGGWALLRWAAPAVALLVLMFPLPFAVETALSGPLRQLATTVSTYALQTLGLPAVAEGNVIHIDEVKIGVLEACSGLGMLAAFFALSATVALVLRRPLPVKLLVFASAVPIGVLMNLFRITAAGIAYRLVGSSAAQSFFHNVAGWLMMPLALALLGFELWFVDHLFLDRRGPGPVPVGREPDKITHSEPAA
jgi:exosortase